MCTRLHESRSRPGNWRRHATRRVASALARGAEPEPPPPAETHTSKLHGHVHVGARSLANVTVTAWGHNGGDLHTTTTDGAAELDPGSLYNVVVNARFVDGELVAIDARHAFEVRDNIELEAGPDGWHGENFPLA